MSYDPYGARFGGVLASTFDDDPDDPDPASTGLNIAGSDGQGGTSAASLPAADPDAAPGAPSSGAAPVGVLAPAAPDAWWLQGAAPMDYGGLFSRDPASPAGLAPWWGQAFLPATGETPSPILGGVADDAGPTPPQADAGPPSASARTDADADDGAAPDLDTEGDAGEQRPAFAPAPSPPASPPPSAPPSAAASPTFQPGGLSSRYESRGDPGTVSTGKGDHGGVSYGAYQIKKANAPAFVAREGAAWPELKGKAPGTAAFDAAWKQAAAKTPAASLAAQHAYIARTHYQPQVTKVRAATGVDVPGRSHALQDVVWSTAVQHGPGNGIVTQAIQRVQGEGIQPSDPGFDPAVINAVYDERGRTQADGQLVHFLKNARNVQQGVANRFVRERRQALQAFGAQGQAGSGG